MSFLLFLIMILFVATNIAIGYGVATVTGHGPPNWRRAVDLLLDREQFDLLREKIRPIFDKIPFFRIRLETARAKDVEEETKTESEPPVVEEETIDRVMEKLAVADIGDLLDDESDAITELAPIHELFDDDLASVLMEQGTEAWLVNEKHVETSLLKLNTVMMKSGRFSAELDWRIRAARGVLSTGDIRQFRDEMKDDCLNYLESQASITEQMKSRLDEFGELKNLAEEVEFANMEQSSQIETTVSNLDRMNLDGNSEEAGNKLIKELANLRLARHRLRDMQDRTFMKIVFYEDRVDTIPPQLYFDDNFGIRGRIGLEVAIHEWWKQKRHQTRQITFALLDFVRFGEANLEHGIATCDRIIKHFGKSLQEHFDALDLTGIYSGNCFMVATVNAGPQKTITEIERIRQNFERTTYRYNSGNESLQLQLTCAVTEALATQSHEEVQASLEKTLIAAKKAGRNHTFHFVPGPLNKPPELVSAPNLVEDPQTIDLD